MARLNHAYLKIYHGFRPWSAPVALYNRDVNAQQRTYYLHTYGVSFYRRLLCTATTYATVRTCSLQHAVRTNRTVVFRDYHCKTLCDLTMRAFGRTWQCPQGHNTDVKKELNLSVHDTWNILGPSLFEFHV